MHRPTRLVMTEEEPHVIVVGIMMEALVDAAVDLQFVVASEKVELDEKVPVPEEEAPPHEEEDRRRQLPQFLLDVVVVPDYTTTLIVPSNHCLLLLQTPVELPREQEER